MFSIWSLSPHPTVITNETQNFAKMLLKRTPTVETLNIILPK